MTTSKQRMLAGGIGPAAAVLADPDHSARRHASIDWSGDV